MIGGGRVTGKAGAFDVGALAIRTDDKPSAGALSTTFSAVRLRRNILRRSSVGVLGTGRWPAAAGGGDNATAGVDADLNWVSLPYGEFTARLLGARLGFSALLSQFNPDAHSVASSVRMRWEYIPGSEMFVVYSDGRDTAERSLTPLQNRSFAVKITRLLRF